MNCPAGCAPFFWVADAVMYVGALLWPLIRAGFAALSWPLRTWWTIMDFGLICIHHWQRHCGDGRLDCELVGGVLGLAWMSISVITFIAVFVLVILLLAVIFGRRRSRR